MTCIIGVACPEQKKVYIGGDSAGVAGLSIQIRGDVKVFENGPFIMGFTTSFRMGQLLHHVFVPPTQPKDMDDMKFMVSKFIPAVKNCLKEGGFQKVNRGQDEGGDFLVGYKGNLYEISSDYQVGVLTDNVASVGCGSQIALGAMYALDNLEPKARIERALEITTHLNAGVRPPFIILESQPEEEPNKEEVLVRDLTVTELMENIKKELLFEKKEPVVAVATKVEK